MKTLTSWIWGRKFSKRSIEGPIRLLLSAILWLIFTDAVLAIIIFGVIVWSFLR